MFLFEISKDENLGSFYFNNMELSDEYLDIEINHMHEVKDLVNAFLIINIISLLIYFFTTSYSKYIFQIAGLSLFTLAILFLIASFSFETFFDKWHDLFFVSDNWLLPAEAKLIQDYPLAYFKYKFILFDAILAFFGIILLILAKKKLFKEAK